PFRRSADRQSHKCNLDSLLSARARHPGFGEFLPDKFRIRIFGPEKGSRWASPFFLEQAFVPESRMDFLRARVLGSELFFCALICSWALRLAMGSGKLSFVSAKQSVMA